jgi:hypothetical protein
MRPVFRSIVDLETELRRVRDEIGVVETRLRGLEDQLVLTEAGQRSRLRDLIAPVEVTLDRLTATAVCIEREVHARRVPPEISLIDRRICEIATSTLNVEQISLLRMQARIIEASIGVPDPSPRDELRAEIMRLCPEILGLIRKNQRRPGENVSRELEPLRRQNEGNYTRLQTLVKQLRPEAVLQPGLVIPGWVERRGLKGRLDEPPPDWPAAVRAGFSAPSTKTAIFETNRGTIVAELFENDARLTTSSRVLPTRELGR